MSIGAIITLIVAAVALAAIVLLVGVKTRGGGRRRLRRHFGREYERTVAVHDGDVQAAEKELDGRLHRYGDFHPLPLGPEERRQYFAQWDAVQELFVDEPHKAVVEADLLIGRLARDRGYPADTYDEQAEALSVHHPHTVHGYRQIHEVALRGSGGGGRPGTDAGRTAGHRPEGGELRTEDLREALVKSRALFGELLRAAPEQHSARHGRRSRTRQPGGGRPQHAGNRPRLPWQSRGDHSSPHHDSSEGTVR
ncbi:hypothetical protein [Streptomyces sp. NPDC003077]|uniref:hypothetical protein n=1 Tax=Streptomyces sp. NPDC003077 TaxID=3154443 RepID=UPI0033AB3AE6